MPSARRFPPPWSVEEANNACFIVRDKDGQALGYFYFEDEPGRRAADVRCGGQLLRSALNVDAVRACFGWVKWGIPLKL